jgi:serine/threonine-protein kinase
VGLLSAPAAPAYLSPEQARGAPLRPEPAVDVYGLGALLYTLLTGRQPYEGATPLETRLLVVREAHAPPRAQDPALDPALEDICLRCMERDPGRRFGSMAELGAALAMTDGDTPPPESAVARALRWLRG